MLARAVHRLGDEQLLPERERRIRCEGSERVDAARPVPVAAQDPRAQALGRRDMAALELDRTIHRGERRCRLAESELRQRKQPLALRGLARRRQLPQRSARRRGLSPAQRETRQCQLGTGIPCELAAEALRQVLRSVVPPPLEFDLEGPVEHLRRFDAARRRGLEVRDRLVHPLLARQPRGPCEVRLGVVRPLREQLRIHRRRLAAGLLGDPRQLRPGRHVAGIRVESCGERLLRQLGIDAPRIRGGRARRTGDLLRVAPRARERERRAKRGSGLLPVAGPDREHARALDTRLDDAPSELVRLLERVDGGAEQVVGRVGSGPHLVFENLRLVDLAELDSRLDSVRRELDGGERRPQRCLRVPAHQREFRAPNVDAGILWIPFERPREKLLDPLRVLPVEQLRLGQQGVVPARVEPRGLPEEVERIGGSLQAQQQLRHPEVEVGVEGLLPERPAQFDRRLLDLAPRQVSVGALDRGPRALLGRAASHRHRRQTQQQRRDERVRQAHARRSPPRERWGPGVEMA